MAAKKLSEMSNEELLKEKKTIQTITYLLIGMILILIVLNTIVFLKKGFSAIHVVPIALLPIVFINLGSLNKVKEELKSRI